MVEYLKKNYKYKLTEEQQKEVCDRYIFGESSGKLSVAFGISPSSIITLLIRKNITRRTCSEAGKNRKFSVEHRKKLAYSKFGDKNPAKRPEVREKISKKLINCTKNMLLFKKKLVLVLVL